jgi:cobalt-zinc-cadmium efflux system membrane fusion protein
LVVVSSGTLRGGLEVPAEVQLNPDRVAHVSPLVAGKLLSIHATIGDMVAADQQLATLRSVELGRARAEVSRARAMRNVARKNLDRQKRLRKAGINSERNLLMAQFEVAEADADQDAAASRLRVYGVGGGSGPDMSLSSPIAGAILERHATQGENVSQDDNLFVVADLSVVWVIGRVYEQQIAQVSIGMAATLTLVAYPGRSWTGKVDYLASALDKETRTLAVRVEIPNPDGVLRPGLFGTLRLAGADGTDGVLVPELAVQMMEGRSVVFVPGEHEGEFEAVTITVGRTSNAYTEVLAGLTSGTQVVAQGAFVLKSELMRGELGHGHAH